MSENNSNTNDSASAGYGLVFEDGELGRWVADPSDPGFEVWEPANAGAVVVVEDDTGAMSEDDVQLATRGFDAHRKPKEVVWSDGRRPDPNRVCTARKTNGEPCTRIAIAGGNVCPAHGGLAPHIQAKARARLQGAADRMAKRLLKIADDENIPPAVQLAATKDALDRAGLSAKTAVEIEVGPSKGFEQILDAVISGGSRAESRSRRGEPNDTTDIGNADWIVDELGIIEAEIVDDLAPFRNHPAPATDNEPPAFMPSNESPADGPAAEYQTGSGLMSMEEALSQLRATPIPQQHPAPRRTGKP